MAVFILTLQCALGLPEPGKDCTLVRSPTDTGKCFLEPECNEVCNTVNDQECKTENRRKCNTVNEQQCRTEQKQECTNVPEEKCSTVTDQECETVNKQKCSQVNFYNFCIQNKIPR